MPRKTCPRCNGNRVIKCIGHTGNNCNGCRGTGTYTCPRCNGEGTVYTAVEEG